MTASVKARKVEILLVDDDPADVLLTQEGLREGNVPTRVHTVGDGVEALSYLQRRGKFSDAPTPDLILLDLKMPKKGGLEVLSEIKADRTLRRIPVVVLTTSDAPEDVLQAYDFQANCYITKPSDLAEFKRVMASIQDFCLRVIKLPPRS